jgi:hypothetical protein
VNPPGRQPKHKHKLADQMTPSWFKLKKAAVALASARTSPSRFFAMVIHVRDYVRECQENCVPDGLVLSLISCPYLDTVNWFQG